MACAFGACTFSAHSVTNWNFSASPVGAISFSAKLRPFSVQSEAKSGSIRKMRSLLRKRDGATSIVPKSVRNTDVEPTYVTSLAAVMFTSFDTRLPVADRSEKFARLVAEAIIRRGLPPSVHASCIPSSINASVNARSVPAPTTPVPVPAEKVPPAPNEPFVIHVDSDADLRGSEPD